MDITFEAYAQLFAGLKARRPKSLDLYLFANQQDYNQVLRERFQAVGTGSWGMAITRQGETSLVAWEGQYSLTDMESVLQHEGFHQFARYLFPRLPSWANEGLAEVFQRGVEVDGKIVLGEVSERDLLMLTRATEQRKFRSFDQFFTMDGRVWNQHVQRGEANTNYLQAWCLVHFFLYADGAKYQGAFMEFLVGLNNELPWKKAFVRAYGSPDFTAMQEKWLAYIAQLQPANYRETIRRLDFLAAGMKALQEQEIYPLTLLELRTKLRNIDFQHLSDLFEKPRAMRAAEEENFEVPTSASPQPKRSEQLREFRLIGTDGEAMVRPADEQALNKLQRRLARQPLQIVTTGLAPRNLMVKWKRTGKRSFQPILATE